MLSELINISWDWRKEKLFFLLITKCTERRERVLPLVVVDQLIPLKLNIELIHSRDVSNHMLFSHRCNRRQPSIEKMEST